MGTDSGHTLRPSPARGEVTRLGEVHIPDLAGTLPSLLLHANQGYYLLPSLAYG